MKEKTGTFEPRRRRREAEGGERGIARRQLGGHRHGRRRRRAAAGERRRRRRRQTSRRRWYVRARGAAAAARAAARPQVNWICATCAQPPPSYLDVLELDQRGELRLALRLHVGGVVRVVAALSRGGLGGGRERRGVEAPGAEAGRAEGGGSEACWERAGDAGGGGPAEAARGAEPEDGRGGGRGRLLLLLLDSLRSRQKTKGGEGAWRGEGGDGSRQSDAGNFQDQPPGFFLFVPPIVGCGSDAGGERERDLSRSRTHRSLGGGGIAHIFSLLKAAGGGGWCGCWLGDGAGVGVGMSFLKCFLGHLFRKNSPHTAGRWNSNFFF
jgi:hypothetical protein